MIALRYIAHELISLFVDDKFLAGGIIAVVAAAWVLQKNGAGSGISGACLFLGCLAVLAVSTIGERRK